MRNAAPAALLPSLVCSGAQSSTFPPSLCATSAALDPAALSSGCQSCLDLTFVASSAALPAEAEMPGFHSEGDFWWELARLAAVPADVLISVPTIG